MEGVESRKEQCRWRLEQLLGSAGVGFEVEPPPGADSIRTEDFAAQFQKLMVNPLTQQDVMCGGPSGDESLMTPKERTLRGDVFRIPYNQSKSVAPFKSPLTFMEGDSHSTGTTRVALTKFSPIHSDQVACHHLVVNVKEPPATEESDGTGNPRDLHQRVVCPRRSGTPGNHDQNNVMDADPESNRPVISCRVAACRGLTPFADVTSDLSHNHTHYYKSPLRGTDITHCTLPGCKLQAGGREYPGDAFPVERLSSSSSPVVQSSVVSAAVASRTAFDPGHLRSCSEALQYHLNTTRTQGKVDHKAKRGLDPNWCLAVPVPRIDALTLDSDLDSVQKEQVPEHLRVAFDNSAGMEVVFSSSVPALTGDESGGGASHGTRPIQKSHSVRRVQQELSYDEKDSDGGDPKRRGQCSLRVLPEHGSQELRSQNCAPLGEWGKQDGRDSFSTECVGGNERLEQKRAQLHKTELSHSILLRHKEHALQELKCVWATVDREGREAWDLGANLRERRPQADVARSQLHSLQLKTEIRGREEELPAQPKAGETGLEKMQRKAPQSTAAAPPSHLSALEREELDRQLDRAKTELFAQQRQFRNKLDSLQERLEEVQQELDLRVESEQILRERCSHLEEQLRLALRQQDGQEVQMAPSESEQTLESQLQGLRVELEEKAGWAGTLEHVVAQKELQLLETWAEMRALRVEHSSRLRETWERAQREKDQHLELLKSEQISIREQEVPEALRQAEEEKRKALSEQTLTYTRHVEALEGCVQVKEEELRKLREVQERRLEELQMKSQRMVQQAVEQEQRKWNAEKRELQRQCGLVEEKVQQVVKQAEEEVERERRSYLSQQNRMMESQHRVRELEAELWHLQKEQASVLSETHRALMEEKQAELQQLHGHAEERQREVSQLQKALEQAEAEANGLRATLVESAQSQKEEVEKVEQLHRSWALALRSECQRLQELLDHTGPSEGAVHLQSNPTVAQAVQTLRVLGDQLHVFISHLRQELNSQRDATQRLVRDKELELQRQREQLEAEHDQALLSLRECLIQVEELSQLQRNWLHDGGGREEDGLVASLRRQLREKDAELWELQRGMRRWREQTAAHLVRRFEEEVTGELERRVPRTNTDKHMKIQRLEDEMRLTMQKQRGSVCSASSPSRLLTDSWSIPAGPRLGSLKLLGHLQVRVRQLHAESWVHACSTAGDLAGSYLETL